MEELMKTMFGTMNTIQGTMDQIKKKQKLSFAQWLTTMSLTHNCKPENVLKQFYLSLEAIKDLVEGDVEYMVKGKKKKGKKKR